MQFCIKSRLFNNLCFSPTTVYQCWSTSIWNSDFISLLFSLLPISIPSQQVDSGMTKNTPICWVVAYILHIYFTYYVLMIGSKWLIFYNQPIFLFMISCVPLYYWLLMIGHLHLILNYYYWLLVISIIINVSYNFCPSFWQSSNTVTVKVFIFWGYPRIKPFFDVIIWAQLMASFGFNSS